MHYEKKKYNIVHDERVHCTSVAIADEAKKNTPTFPLVRLPGKPELIVLLIIVILIRKNLLFSSHFYICSETSQKL